MPPLFHGSCCVVLQLQPSRCGDVRILWLEPRLTVYNPALLRLTLGAGCYRRQCRVCTLAGESSVLYEVLHHFYYTRV